MRPHTTIYVLILLYVCVLILLYICPQVIHHSQSFQSLTSTSSHSIGSHQSSESIGYSQGDDVDDETLRMLLQALHLSAYCHTCVLILLCMCPHTAIYVSAYCYMCPHSAICVSAYCLKCVRILPCGDEEPPQDAAAHPRCPLPALRASLQ